MFSLNCGASGRVETPGRPRFHRLMTASVSLWVQARFPSVLPISVSLASRATYATSLVGPVEKHPEAGAHRLPEGLPGGLRGALGHVLPPPRVVTQGKIRPPGGERVSERR